MMKRTRLVNARLAKGWSQERAAEAIGVTRNTYSQWELGKATPYPVYIHRLVQTFGAPAATLDLVEEGTLTAESVSYAQALKSWTESPLAIYAQGIAACQDLYFAGRPRQVEALLPLYLAQTAQLAEQPSPLQQSAARLASHAQQIACELATDREDFGAARQAGEKALQYAQLADDANLQVVALISLANLGFHRKLSLNALQSYKQAVSLLDDRVTPLLKGRTYAGLAEVYAMRQDLEGSMRAMGMAYEAYPEKPEDDPAYPYLRSSRYSLYVFGDVQSRLFLGQPKEAEQALVAMRKETNDPETEPITRLDMLYYQADTRIQQGELEASQVLLTEGATLAKELGSRLYFNKLAMSCSTLQQRYPKEPAVLALEEAFQPW